MAVGEAYLADSPGGGGESINAFLWNQKDGLIDLNNIIAPGSDNFDVLLSATDVNNRGQIVGYGRINGQTQAFLATPVPEPTTEVVILAFGVLGATLALKRKKKLS